MNSEYTINLEYITNLKEFAKLLVIANGIDHTSLTFEKQTQKEQEILAIFFDFADQTMNQSTNPELKQAWKTYQESSYSNSDYQKSELLESALNQITSKFLEL